MGKQTLADEEWLKYKKEMTERLWRYQKERYKGKEKLLEKRHEENPDRPPVFLRPDCHENVLVDQKYGKDVVDHVRALLPVERRHRWFGSMTSSQALAQSVFGNLKALGKLACLVEILGDDGKPLFLRGRDNIDGFEMEKVVMYLGETSKKTNVDVFFGGSHQVAVECKLTETEAGRCSRPRLRDSASNFKKDFCRGDYCCEGDRTERCSLTRSGVEYWKYIPDFFNWNAQADNSPCPLNATYQLVRNVLAACLRSGQGGNDNNKAEQAAGHAVLVYDENNPHFQEKGQGKGRQAFLAVKSGLKNPALIQSCTWQRIIEAMSKDKELSWLVDGLREKYGL